MYWLIKYVLLGPLVHWVTRPRLIGKLPAGPVVFAPNHLSEIDSLVVCAALSRRVTFVAKSDYFARGSLRGRLYGTLCRVTGQIPIERSGAGSADAALEGARGTLCEGGVWVIYPEGTRSPDGRLYRGRTGAMRVALSVPDAAVVPVGLRGTREIDPPGHRGWRRGRTEVHLGDPIDLSPWRHRADDPEAWREATDALMAAIQKLSGQEYVDRHPTADELQRRGETPDSPTP
ncbi:1-acyl-sn-glycerol-3-phosphate acyltransferase [Mumia sp. zg.B21]|uniref:lysophospholipid acyltransferase family protein n=1 Tax=Mumia sp. zg.B21 TaxID=2855447 RepID=UPI001C6EED54|nr:lysophospholipid acyltransferase family protein [Mumia sp. zg.B21]MBW9209033.1 1-acyl-sn-glycerol-3-phosphate acyltransferase [Mumia sp. zg.B21]